VQDWFILDLFMLNLQNILELYPVWYEEGFVIIYTVFCSCKFCQVS